MKMDETKWGKWKVKITHIRMFLKFLEEQTGRGEDKGSHPLIAGNLLLLALILFNGYNVTHILQILR